MTTLILFVFYLFSLPRDVRVCSIWVSAGPSAEDVAAACPPGDLSAYRLELVSVITGETWCIKSGAELYSIATACDLKGHTLDHFRFDLYRTTGRELACSVESQSASAPSPAEVAAQCGDATAARYSAGELLTELVERREITPAASCLPPAPMPGPGLLDQPAAPADLATDEPLWLLAYELIWYDLVRPGCEGGLSGVDLAAHAATPCGMSAASARVGEWQNSLDGEIYSAALNANVPPRLLKWLIRRESQFWPLAQGSAGEVGLVQLTDAGADTVLRVWLPGYDRLGVARRRELRAVWLAGLRLEGTPLDALAQARADLPEYARALAAYYCVYGSWESALGRWNTNHEIGGASWE